MPAFLKSIITNNLSKNLSWNLAGQILAKISLLLFHIYFANLVGTNGYGVFSFVFVAGIIILQPILDMGLNQLITKWVSRGNKEVIRNSFQIKFYVSVFLLPIAIFLGWWNEIHPILLGTILIYFLINTFQQSLFGILRGLEDLRPESITVALQNLLALQFL
jgi:Polysaccharide biosynthesis protein.